MMEVVEDNGENVLRVTIKQSVTTAVVNQNITSLNTTNIYYVCGWVKGVASNVNTDKNRISVCNTLSTSPSVPSNSSEYVFTSDRGTLSNTGETTWQKFRLFNRGENAVGNVYYWKNIQLYDLTAIFGAGNEPTKEWCDETIAKHGNLIKNNIACNVKQAYIGVNNIARKVKKSYVGINDIAHQFYARPKITETFSSRIIPVFTSNTATNKYGEWAVSGSSINEGDYWNGVDGDNTVKVRLERNSDAVAVFQIDLPPDVSIRPTAIYLKLVTLNYCYIYGLNEDTNTWAQLYSWRANTTNGKETTASISTSNFYKSFKLEMTAYSTASSRPAVYEFDITSGYIKY